MRPIYPIFLPTASFRSPSAVLHRKNAPFTRQKAFYGSKSRYRTPLIAHFVHQNAEILSHVGYYRHQNERSLRQNARTRRITRHPPIRNHPERKNLTIRRLF